MPGRTGGLLCACNCGWSVCGEEEGACALCDDVLSAAAGAGVAGVALDPDPDRLRMRSTDSFRWSSTASGGNGVASTSPALEGPSLPSLLRLLGTVASAGGWEDPPGADDRGPDSDARVLSGECADEPLLRSLSRSRSGAGDAEAETDVASELEDA